MEPQAAQITVFQHISAYKKISNSSLIFNFQQIWEQVLNVISEHTFSTISRSKGVFVVFLETGRIHRWQYNSVSFKKSLLVYHILEVYINLQIFFSGTRSALSKGSHQRGLVSVMDSREHKVFLYHCLLFIHFGERASYPCHKFKEAKEEIFNQANLFESRKKANIFTEQTRTSRESHFKNTHAA